MQPGTSVNIVSEPSLGSAAGGGELNIPGFGWSVGDADDGDDGGTEPRAPLVAAGGVVLLR